MLIGYHSYPPEVGSLSFDALEAGLRPGDTIQFVEDKPIRSWEELIISYATREPGSTVAVTVARGDQTLAVPLVVHRDPRRPLNLPDFDFPVELRVGTVAVDSAADRAGVAPGDLLVGVDGHPVRTWSEFQDLIRRRPNRDITLTVGRGVEADGSPTLVDLPAHPEGRPADRAPKLRAGFEPLHPPTLDFVDPDGPGWAAGLRAGDTVSKVGGVPVTSWFGLWREATWGGPEGAPVVLTAARPGGAPFDATVTPGPIPDWGLHIYGLPALGLAGREPDDLVIGELGPDAPEQLRSGDVVVALAGQIIPRGATDDATMDWEVEDPGWMEVLGLLNHLAGSTYTVEVERGGTRHSFTIEAATEPTPALWGYLGVGPLNKEVLIKRGPVEAIVPSLKAPFRILKDFYDGIRAMLLRRARRTHPAGRREGARRAPRGRFRIRGGRGKRETGWGTGLALPGHRAPTGRGRGHDREALRRFVDPRGLLALSLATDGHA